MQRLLLLGLNGGVVLAAEIELPIVTAMAEETLKVLPMNTLTESPTYARVTVTTNVSKWKYVPQKISGGTGGNTSRNWGTAMNKVV